MKDWFNRMGDKAASWRLPVVIPVPNRDNLIAMGLMALAFGLLVGFALGPLLAPAGMPRTLAISIRSAPCSWPTA